MVYFHIHWTEQGKAMLWAEGEPRKTAPRGFADFSLGAVALVRAAARVMWYKDGFVSGRPVKVSIPVRNGRPVPSSELRSACAETGEWLVEAVEPTMPNLFMFLSDVRGRKFANGVFLAEDVLQAVAIFKMVSALVASGRYLPALERKDEAGEDGFAWRSVWEPAPLPSELKVMRRKLRDSFPQGPRIAESVFRRLLDEFVRSAVSPGSAAMDPRVGFETAHDAWMDSLSKPDGTVRWLNDGDMESLAESLASWKSSIGETPEDRDAVRFSLREPNGHGEGEWRICLDVPPEKRGGYVALGQAGMLFSGLKALATDASGECSAPLAPEAVETFLASGVSVLREAGYAVRVPDGVKGEHLEFQARIDTPEERPENADAVVAEGFQVQLDIRVDGELVTEEEVKFLLDQGTSIVFFRDRWIEVDREVLREALKAFRAADARKYSLHEIAVFSCGMGRIGKLRIANVEARGWLRGLLNELRSEDKLKIRPAPEGFCGKLRPFQERGWCWMDFLAKWGFGACLADDMGCGKTVQTIAFILECRAKAPSEGPVLVAAPVTIIGNWKRELEKFAPDLKVLVHQGPAREHGAQLAMSCAASDVVLAGYSMIARDVAELSYLRFSAVILDEAQTVKNPATRVSAAVRAIQAPRRIALTGTPLENSASDIWALEEFLNPGLLGSRAAFEKAYAKPIAQGCMENAAAKLRRVLAPFVLRRLKTDPGVAGELGSKRIIREYCPLSAVQRARYEEALDEFKNDSHADSTGIERRGRVLALITRLKEICDSTDLLSPQMHDAKMPFAPSGKLHRLEELLKDVFAAGESVLVFTQYAKMGALLQRRLLEKFGVRMPFLHGGLSRTAREKEIEDFNNSKEPNAFILSLKAGGFGLNLTRATRVVHFDRWWNPAVENQATDRAHRIGQTRNVTVHTFICAGTVEDRVDRLLESKSELAAAVVGSGEAFLAGMEDARLEEFVKLDGSVVEEVEE